MNIQNKKSISMTTLEDPLARSTPVLKSAIRKPVIRTYKRNSTCEKDAVLIKSQSTSAILPIQPDSK